MNTSENSTPINQIRLSNLALSQVTRNKIDRIILEHRQKEKLAKFGLKPKRNILLYGPDGTGKKTTAIAIANQLDMPLIENKNDIRPGVVYLVDAHSLSSIEHAIGYLNPNSIVIIVSSHISNMSDYAISLFDEIIEYNLPDDAQIEFLIKNCLHQFELVDFQWESIIKEARGFLTHKDIFRACSEAAKTCVLNNDKYITELSIIAQMDNIKKMATISMGQFT